MRTFTRLTVILLSIILSTNFVFSQDKKIIVGTWEGDATLQSQPQPNTLTLKMELKEEKLSGNISGQFGVLANTPLKEIKFENDSLSFKLEVAAPNGGIFTLVFSLIVKDDKMEGDLEVREFQDKGTWAATRKKKEDKSK
jgi:hypothetical protein